MQYVLHDSYQFKTTFGLNPHLFLTKVNKVLQINVISVVDYRIVDHLSHFIPCLAKHVKKCSFRVCTNIT